MCSLVFLAVLLKIVRSKTSVSVNIFVYPCENMRILLEEISQNNWGIDVMYINLEYFFSFLKNPN